MIEALRKLGVQIGVSAAEITVTPGNLSGDCQIDCGLAGTVMRFIPPLAALAAGRVEFDGDEAARKRPMATAIDSLRKLGVSVDAASDFLPFAISAKGSVLGGKLSIDASASSQFVSGLLLAGARFDRGLRLTHTGHSVPSMPHIDMTIECLRQRGVNVERPAQPTWDIQPSSIRGREVEIEPDLSNAGPFLAAALVTGSTVSIPWPTQTTQAGDFYRKLLQQMGAEVRHDGDKLTLSGSGNILGITENLSAAGELVPTIAAIAALAESESVITGIAHLRGHETDRLKALVTEIKGLGGDAKELEDGIVIRPRKLHGGVWHTYHDHRMATAGAIIGLRVAGVEIEDISVTSKTMPQFRDLWLEMLK
jgi:3-phosphoshikimate 1-carboxyvinyltransferase